jgi:hypothetical protein
MNHLADSRSLSQLFDEDVNLGARDFIALGLLHCVRLAAREL